MKLDDEHFKNLEKKKKIALRNADFIRKMAYDNDFYLQRNSLLKRAERIEKCLSYWEWAKFDSLKILDLKKVSRCKDVYCPNCRRFNIWKFLSKNMQKFIYMCEHGYNPYMMTLTVPNCEDFELKQTIEEMNDKFKLFYRLMSSYSKKHMLKKRMFDIGAAIKVLEVTYNYRTDTYHPHFHVICFVCDELYQEFEKYIPGGWHYKTEEFIYYSDADIFLQVLWTRCYYEQSKQDLKKFGDEELLQADIRELYIPSGINEIFKYVFKDSNVKTYETFKTVFDAIANKKLRQAYGDLYNIKDDEKVDKIIEANEVNEYLEFETVVLNNINDAVKKFPDYKKISRFSKDNSYEVLKCY